MAIAGEVGAAVGLERPRPCHNDLLPGNIIRAQGDGRLLLVDWEYSGMGHPYFDLGNLSINNGFDEETDERLLTAYQGTPPSLKERATLSLMRLLSDAREAAWGVVQASVSELDFDFEGYAGRHFERLLEAAGQPDLWGMARNRRRGSRWPERVSFRTARAWSSSAEVSAARPSRITSRELGERDVVLLDRNELTSGSTFHSAGLVGQLRGSLSLTRMMMNSVALYGTLDCGWVPCGGIRLACTPEREQEVLRQVAWARTFGLPLELISAREAKELFPLMSTDGVRCASYLPTDGYLDPSLLTMALAEARVREAVASTRTRG